uniref:Uncharacterized protein n=1 Tax=Knipowitschia caucasica TaxID=637954 RepID=A0AAV2KW62_KNICA
MTMRESIIQCHATFTLALIPRHSRRGLQSRYFMRKISLQVYFRRQSHQMMSVREKCCLRRSLTRHLLPITLSQMNAGG